MTRKLAAAGALLFALSACTAAPGQPLPAPAPDKTEEIALAAICQAVGSQELLPGQDTVDYSTNNGPPANSPGQPTSCLVEPEDGYAEVGTEVEIFGTGGLTMAWHSAGQLTDVGYPEYEAAAEPRDFLANSRADPLHDQIPCETETCEDGIVGYLHSHQYEALVGRISVEARIDFYTTDLDADKAGRFSGDADEVLTAYLDVVAAQAE